MHANKLSQFHWKICKNLLFGLCSATLEQGERDRAFYSVQKMYLLHSHTQHSHPIYRNKSALSHVMWVWAEARWSMKNHFFPSICHCELRLFLICDNLWHTKPYFIFQFCLAAFFCALCFAPILQFSRKKWEYMKSMCNAREMESIEALCMWMLNSSVILNVSSFYHLVLFTSSSSNNRIMPFHCNWHRVILFIRVCVWML